MAEEKKIDIDEFQKQLTQEIIEFIRTKLSDSKYKEINCALVTINKVTGQLLINTANAPLMADTKMMLQEGVDMLNRQQMVNSLVGKLITIAKGGPNGSTIIHR